MDTLSAFWPFVQGINWSLAQKASNAELCLFVVSLDKLLNKYVSSGLNELAQGSCDVAQMHIIKYPIFCQNRLATTALVIGNG